MLRVSRSGYYAWQRRPESQRSRENRKLLVKIKEIHQQSRQNYGSPRVHKALRQSGIGCGLHRVARLMQENDIIAKPSRKFKVTTDSNHAHPVAPNILGRDFEAEHPNQKWVADNTYILTGQGWLYLAVVLDLFNRMVVGWSMKPRMTKELVCDALRMAIATRLPFQGLLAHSDRDCQYVSIDHQKMLSAFGISCSMSRKANCWDNAVIESFFATLKKELVHHVFFENREQAQREIFSYIEVFYNRIRLYSALGYISPCEFEKQNQSSLIAA